MSTQRTSWILPAVAMIGFAWSGPARAQVNLISNGDFEIGFIDDDPGSPTFGLAFVQDWFRSANGYESIYVGDDASTGAQSVGYDTSSLPPDYDAQANSALWADWRSAMVSVNEGEELQWNFSYKMLAGSDGELRAEMRSFDQAGAFSNAGTQILILSPTGAINQGNGATDDCVDRGDGWFDCSVDVTVPIVPEVISSYDLRFNNIFTNFIIPFVGEFRLDDASILRMINVDGDFNDDGLYDCVDINALVQEIATMTDNPIFDLTGDNLVNTDDLDSWLVEAGAVNVDQTGGNPYLPGDADLDGVVDVSDFNAWNNNKFTNIAAWCSGDFTADGVVDVSDFNTWNGHKFNSSMDGVAVPEPAMASFLAGAFVCGACCLRFRPA